MMLLAVVWMLMPLIVTPVAMFSMVYYGLALVLGTSDATAQTALLWSTALCVGFYAGVTLYCLRFAARMRSQRQ